MRLQFSRFWATELRGRTSSQGLRASRARKSPLRWSSWSSAASRRRRTASTGRSVREGVGVLAGPPEELVVDVSAGDDENQRVVEVGQVWHGGECCRSGTLGSDARRRVFGD